MRLGTRFRISAAASLGSILAIGLVVGWFLVETGRAHRGDRLASELQQASFERGLLRDEYLLLGEPRARGQWEARTAALRGLLARAALELEGGDDRRVVGEMAALVDQGAALFAELLRDEGAPEGPQRATAAAFRQRATSRELLISHDLNGRARQLATAAAARLAVTQRGTVLALVLLLVAVVAVTLSNTWMAAVTLERRLVRLRDGAERVASGALDHRLALQGDDELADLGHAFDRMTERLQQTYASLEGEVADRRRAQHEVGRLNEALKRHLAALEVSNRELEAFSSAVSHDLRAPLRSISGFSQAVLEDWGPRLDAQGRQYLEMANDAAREMGQLIDDLLGLSRVARIDMAPQPVDLAALAAGVVAELRRGEPGRSVEVEIAPDLVVQGDPTLLRLAMENLLRNAWKFTSHHPAARITVGRREARGRQAYFVADDGAGFDMAYVDKLFQPFQRLHRASEFPGTGIGLATVSRVVRRHGGEAWAEGAVEQGATIFFTLQGHGGHHAEQGHPAGRGQPEGRAADGAGLPAEQDRQRPAGGA